MHNVGLVQPHTTVEAYGVHHILNANTSFMDSSIKDEIESIISKVKGMEAGSTEQNKYLSTVLHEYYYSRNKYEMIHLIRRMTWEYIRISYKNVPFFQIIVRDFTPIVREARHIDPVTVVKH